MRIIKAKKKPSVRSQLLALLDDLLARDDRADIAIYLDSLSELRQLQRIAKDKGVKIRSQILDSGGWSVWVLQ